MELRSYIRKIIRKVPIVTMAVCLALCACDGVIYDDEGDCSVTYLVKFKYDYNMKYADAFANEVESVTLYLLDSDGNIVWQKTESGDALAADDYAMTVDVDPGEYDLMAWCGTKDNGSFTIASASVGTGLTCTLNRSHDTEGNAYVDGELDRLFYGSLTGQTFPKTYGTYTYTVPLIKDTNHITVVLQNLSGEPVDADDYTFYITDNNGSMDWDNSLLSDETVTYYAWYTATGEAEIDVSTMQDGSVISMFNAAIAEFTVPRLVDGQNMRLTIAKSDTGDIVLSIPFIEYALLVKGYYNREMDDQEYLDRQDEYDMIFFIDEGNRWLDQYIYINSWKVVLQNTDI